MRASVVVPTRDRADALERCLNAIAAEATYGTELVVVDDGSVDRDALARTLGRAALEPRLIRTPGVGPAAARNLGARASRGEVVCFVDDDCEPQSGWLSAMTSAALESGTAAGRTVPSPGAAAAVRASQAIVDELTISSLDPASGRLAFAPSCNLAIAASEIGSLRFDESFPLAAGEDREWSARASAADLGPRFVSEAVVVHRPDLALSGFARQHYRYGRGASRYRAATGARPAALAFYAGLIRRGFSEGAAVGGLVISAQALTAAGAAVERLSRRRRGDFHSHSE